MHTLTLTAFRILSSKEAIATTSAFLLHACNKLHAPKKVWLRMDDQAGRIYLVPIWLL